MIRDLNEAEINNILSSQVLGRLACTNGLNPYIVPLTYMYDGEYIYGQTVKGKKLSMLRKNPNVCFEVDMLTDMFNWSSVLVFGKFEELKEEAAATAREKLFNSVFTLLTGSAVHKHEHGTVAGVDDSSRQKPVMYRIKIKKITGRTEKK
ncbi:MAG: pyridoxamine 5'-phosphate oxidase family protein [Ferruginibacter sp.]